MMINKFKRVRSLAALAGASALVLAGCASAEETPSASTDSDTGDTSSEEVDLPEGTLAFAN